MGVGPTPGRSSHDVPSGSPEVSLVGQDDDLVGLAMSLGRSSAAHGSCLVRDPSSGASPEIAILLRPQVPMGLFVGLTAVCSLGLLDVARGGGGGDVAIDWPSGIVSGSGEQVARVGVRAATGDLGMFAVAIVDADLPVLTGGRSVEESVRLVRDAIVGRVDAWSDAVRDGRAQAGPLAPVLSECYDSIARMGEPVRAISRDGREVCRGVLAGVDVWGRVTIHTAFGQDIAFAGEQASLISL